MEFGRHRTATPLDAPGPWFWGDNQTNQAKVWASCRIASREDIEAHALTALGIEVLTDEHWSSTEADVRFSLHRAQIRNVPQQEDEGARRRRGRMQGTTAREGRSRWGR